MEKIVDRIYGGFEIKEPVIIDLLNSKAIKRLKGISMQGLPQRYWPFPTCSRYEHSVGVFLLLRKLGVSLEEQIAGLLHDVSHTAFSHVVDWVLGDPSKEDYQDSNHLSLLQESDAAPILKKFKFNLRSVADLETFPILDSPIPDLCADRFDYAIREINYVRGEEAAKSIVQHLSPFQNHLVFDSISAAELFSRNYLARQREHWAADESRARYYLFSEVLKRSLKINLINLLDFKKTDEEVLEVLEHSKDSKICETLYLLKRPLKLVESKEETAITLQKKVRYVDPLINLRGNLERLSSLSSSYAKFLQEELNNMKMIKKMEICLYED
jgi:HD superfamily phosphohydrolase